jgi:hypothetical protein
MTSPQDEERPIIGQDSTDEMAMYGIIRIPVDYFHFKEFRYSNLEDAIAQAKRQQPKMKG